MRLPCRSPMPDVPMLALRVALLLALPIAAAAADFPTLRNGQWEMTTTSSSAPDRPRTMTMCVDTASQKEMHDMGAGVRKDMCSKSETRTVGGQYITDSVCKFGESVVKSHAVMAPKGDTEYRIEASATYDPPLVKDLKASTTVVEGKFVGACREGLVPGDVIAPNGQKINLRQIAAEIGRAHV
jgi:hypothetical protein